MKRSLFLVTFIFVVNNCTVPVEVEIDNGIRNGEKVQELIDDHNPDRVDVYVDGSVLYSSTSFSVDGAFLTIYLDGTPGYFDLTNMLAAMMYFYSFEDVSTNILQIYMD